MIIVRIVGGLGNQMFQYAYAKALQHKGYDVKLDISKFKKYKLHGAYQLDKYNIDLETANPISESLPKKILLKSLKESSLLFDEKMQTLQGNEYVKGYFQTEKYFTKIRVILLEQFKIKSKISTKAQHIAKDILSFKNTCSLHIRRGDYVSNPKAKSVHGTCSLDYYKKALQLINKTYDNTLFFIFSDDIEWVKENLLVENAIYVEGTKTPHEDLYLMSLCHHNITANSSFSWWGAWLNTNPNKMVIAPKKWFVSKENEVACENWIQI